MSRCDCCGEYPPTNLSDYYYDRISSSNRLRPTAEEEA